MDKTEFKKACLDYLRQAPVMSVTNLLRMQPLEHEGNIYYYDFHPFGRLATLCLNTARQQWYVDKQHHGDDASSLVLYIHRAVGHPYNDEELMADTAVGMAKRELKVKESQQRIPFKSLPLYGRKWVAKPYGNAINTPFMQGLSKVVLMKQCYVVYRTACKADEEDSETLRLLSLIRDTKNLRKLPKESKQAISEHFATAIALRNVNGGLQLHTGEFSYPELREGYCLFGGKEVEKGETLYVYENVMDYLAMLERRHASGTGAIMPPAHHLIINGEDNLKEALAYIHDRCDYLNVVCLFPNDAEGHKLYEQVRQATLGTAEDASGRMYANEHFFSLYAKTANIFDEAHLRTCRDKMQRLINQEVGQHKKNSETDATEIKKMKKAIKIPSAESKEGLKGFRL